MLFTLFTCALVSLLLYRVYKFQKQPGPFSLLRPATWLGELSPTATYLNVNSRTLWRSRFALNLESNCTNIAVKSPFYSLPIYYVSDPDAIQTILNDRFNWKKPLEFYQILFSLGLNVLVSEDEMHRRQRRITAPAFGEKNTELVWQESQTVAKEWFEDLDARSSSGETEIDVVKECTHAALMIISGAAFGLKLPWRDHSTPPAGHQISIAHALQGVSEYTLVKAVAPKVCFNIFFIHM